MRDIKEGLAWGTLARFLSYTSSSVIVLLITPIMIGQLGKTGFGFWSLIGSLIGISTFFDLGLSSSLKRFLPLYEVRGDKEKYYQTIVISFVIFCVCSFVFISFAFLLRHIIFNNFAQGITHETFLFVYSVVAIDFAIQLPMRVVVGFLESKLKYDSLAFVELGKALTRGAGIYGMLHYGMGLEGVASVCLGTNLLGHIFLLLYFRRCHWHKIVNKQFRAFNTEILPELVSYSWINFLGSLTDIVKFRLDDFIISRSLGLSLVTPYAVSMKLVNYFDEFISIVMGQTVPVFSRLDTLGNQKSLMIAFAMLTKISTAISIYIGGVLIIFGKPFLDRWIGPSAKEAYPVLVILSVAFVLALAQYPMGNLMKGISRHGILLACNIIEALANLVLSLVMVQHYGILGVAIGTAVPMIISKLLLQPYLFCKLVALTSYASYYRNIFGPPLFTSIFVMGMCGVLITPFLKATYPALFLGVIATTPYFIAIYCLVFSKEEKHNYFHPLYSRLSDKFLIKKN